MNIATAGFHGQGTAAAQPNNVIADAMDLQIPPINPKRSIDFEAIRAPGEKSMSRVVFAVGLIFLIAVAGTYLVALVGSIIELLTPYDPADDTPRGSSLIHCIIILLYFLFLRLMLWFGHKMSIARLESHCVEVGATQFPQIYSVVKQGADFLQVPLPRIFIFQGHGFFELLVSKYFSRRGHILISSNMMDEFSKRPSSQEFMMFVGRQLGLIKVGYFKNRIIKHWFGMLANFFYLAWRRRCHLTADRFGLLFAGSLYPAEQALVLITVGAGLAPGTNFDAISEQSTRLRDGFFGWFFRITSSYPPMVDRIVRLRQFAHTMTDMLEPASVGKASPRYAIGLGAFPIHHTLLRSVPLLIIHGHDQVALLELQNLLLARFPYIFPRVMRSEHHGTMGMSEKFERVTADLAGAIALITPDDIASSLRKPDQQLARARQNVIMEIGWVWGRLGRHKCMLLKKGNLELPSDLAGVDVGSYNASPLECLPALHEFIEQLAHK